MARIVFGPYEIDTVAAELRKRGRKLRLAPQPVRLLALLASSPGQVFTREEIRRELWDADTFVDFDQGLNACISVIRAVLAEDAKKPKFIETLPRRGYRFLAAAESTGIRTPKASSDPIPPEAWDHYSSARKSFAQFGMESLEEARQQFERALALAPGYAMAHSGLGATHALRNIFRRDGTDLDRAKVHLETAVALDGELAEPWPWLCYVYARLSDLPRAIDAGHRGVMLQPDLVQAHYFLSLALIGDAETNPGSYQQSVKHLLRATELNPRWHASWFVLSSIALLNGKYHEADYFAERVLLGVSTGPFAFIGGEMIQSAVAMRRCCFSEAVAISGAFLAGSEASDHMYRDSMRAITACVRGDAQLRLGCTHDALSSYRLAWQLVQEHPRMMAHARIRVRAMAGLIAAYTASGDTERASGLVTAALNSVDEVCLMKHNAAGAQACESFYPLAVALCRMKNLEPAVRMLDLAVKKGWRDAEWLRHDPELEPIRSQQGVVHLIEQIESGPQVTFATLSSRSSV